MTWRHSAVCHGVSTSESYCISEHLGVHYHSYTMASYQKKNKADVKITCQLKPCLFNVTRLLSTNQKQAHYLAVV